MFAASASALSRYFSTTTQATQFISEFSSERAGSQTPSLVSGYAMLAGRGVNMAKGKFVASFELTMARKDVQLMLSTAGDRPMAVLPCVASRMDKLIEQGHGAMDASVIGIDAVKQN